MTESSTKKQRTQGEFHHMYCRLLSSGKYNHLHAAQTRSIGKYPCHGHSDHTQSPFRCCWTISTVSQFPLLRNHNQPKAISQCRPVTYFAYFEVDFDFFTPAELEPPLLSDGWCRRFSLPFPSPVLLAWQASTSALKAARWAARCFSSVF